MTVFRMERMYRGFGMLILNGLKKRVSVLSQSWNPMPRYETALKYVDISSKVERNVAEAIQDRIKNGVGNLYILVNYTGLYSTRNTLKKMEEESR